MTDVSSFTVKTPALAAAAVLINSTVSSVEDVQSSAASAGAQSGAFGGEPIEAVYSAMCTRAGVAMGEIASTMQQLSQNVAAASVGYLVTDQGILPTFVVGGKP
jgi:hypothetical protein